MVRAKFIIAFILFLSAALFIGEVYSFFLSDFESKYANTGYWAIADDEEEKIKDMVIEMTGEDFPVFALEKEPQGAFSRTVTVFANEAGKSALVSGIMNIREGEKKSFFTGTTTFIFEDFANVPAERLREIWYPATREEIADKTPSELEEYSGGFIRDPMPDDSKYVILAIWAVIAIILLFLTWYDIVYSKKEQIVRIVLGADSSALILKKISQDIICYSLAAIIAFTLARLLTNTFFHIWISLLCLAVFFLLNSGLIFFKMGRASRRIEIKSSNATKKTLNASLGIKLILGIISVSVLSITIGLANEGIKLKSQSDTYENMKGQAHVRVSYPFDFEKMDDRAEYWEGDTIDQPLNTDEQLEDNFFRYASKYLDLSIAVFAIQELYMEEDKALGKKTILANIEGIKAHKDAFPEWDQMSNNEGNYLIVPKGTDADFIQEKLLLPGRDGEFRFDGIFEYSKDVKIISEYWQEPLEIRYSFEVKNPIIVLDSHDYSNLPIYPPTYELQDSPRNDLNGLLISGDLSSVVQFSSVNNDRELIEGFAKALNSEIIDPELMEYEIVDLNSWYDELWGLIGRAMLIALVLTALLLLLKSLVTIIILNLEYEVNAKELTVKKVMGFSIYERYNGMFKQSVVLFAVMIIIPALAYFKFGVGIGTYIFLGWLIVLVSDILLMLSIIRKSDKARITKVLKGGI